MINMKKILSAVNKLPEHKRIGKWFVIGNRLYYTDCRVAFSLHHEASDGLKTVFLDPAGNLRVEEKDGAIPHSITKIFDSAKRDGKIKIEWDNINNDVRDVSIQRLYREVCVSSHHLPFFDLLDITHLLISTPNYPVFGKDITESIEIVVMPLVEAKNETNHRD